MKKIILFILIVAVLLSFTGCKDPESSNSTIDFNDISVSINSESGVQAGMHTPLIYIDNFEEFQSKLGVTLSVNIEDQDGNEVSLNEDGQFLVEYDKIYSIVYTLSCDGAEPKNYYATVTALTGDMVKEPENNDDDEKVGEYDYLSFVTVDNNSCDVSANITLKDEEYTFTLPKNLIIPAVYNDKNVIAITGFAQSYIETVSLPQSVVTVGERAFSVCENLTSINLQYIKTVKKGAFYRCAKLTSLNLSSIEYLEDEVFLSCAGLINIDLGEDLISIGYHAFKDCSSLTSLTIRSDSVINLTGTYLEYLSGVTVYVSESVIASYQSQNPILHFGVIG